MRTSDRENSDRLGSILGGQSTLSHSTLNLAFEQSSLLLISVVSLVDYRPTNNCETILGSNDVVAAAHFLTNTDILVRRFAT